MTVLTHEETSAEEAFVWGKSKVIRRPVKNNRKPHPHTALNGFPTVFTPNITVGLGCVRLLGLPACPAGSHLRLLVSSVPAPGLDPLLSVP